MTPEWAATRSVLSPAAQREAAWASRHAPYSLGRVFADTPGVPPEPRDEVPPAVPLEVLEAQVRAEQAALAVAELHRGQLAPAPPRRR